MMLGDQDISYSLICAVCEGRLERVRELISSYGLSYSQAWAEGYVLLCDAVDNKHTEVAKLLLTNGSKVNSKNKKRTDTPLHFAVRNGDIEIVKMLLDRGADIDAINLYNVTPLHIAVESKRVEIVELLLNHGACVNARNCNSSTPLLLAAKEGSEEIVKLLLKHGADVNSAYTCTSSEGYTPLCLAVKGGYEKVVKLLLKCGANVDAQDTSGKSVLHLAVEKEDERFVKLLLERGANIDAQDKDGKTVLHFAVEKGDEELVKLLLECGANVDAQDKGHKNALHFAVEKRDEKFQQLLEGHSEVDYILSGLFACVDFKDESDCTPFHIAAQKRHQDKDGETGVLFVVEKGNEIVKQFLEGHLEIFDVLSKFCAGIDSKDEYGSTPLHIAAQKGHLQVVDVLLKFGAGIDFKDDDGRTALHIASKEGHKETVIALLEHGSDINIMSKNSGFKDECSSAPLHIAAQEGHLEIVEVLVKFGANIDSKDEGGRTALHIAGQKGHLEVVEFLLKFVAGIDSKDKGGRTALHIACKVGHEEIVIALLKHGSDINILSKNDKTPLDYAWAHIHPFYGEFWNKDVSLGPSIVHILKRHMVRMKTANLFVSRENLLSLRCNYALECYQYRCEEEIASLKSEKFDNANVSFYDILTKGISQLAMYAGNESIVQVLRSDDYKVRFPIYASMINSNFRKGERRKELLEQGHKIFHSFFNNFPRLPHDCTAEIFSYLSDEDLRMLIYACKPVRVSSPNTWY